MPAEPAIKRAIAFVDGQNLFRCAKTAFGYSYPNFDVHALASAVCARQDWQLGEVRFYTGIPDPADDPAWSHFWAGKLLQMSRQGVITYTRSLRYRNQRLRLPDGTEHTILVSQEKGIDVRLALDIVSAAHHQRADVLLVFSQDQDLSEVADEIRTIAVAQDLWIKTASAFPSSPTSTNRRGINGTDWIRIDRALYDSCLDPRDYRPRPNTP
ncbi:MAG: NYN domain-containing protein [Verrucomicrobia bacterium]|nr:NYN domain-containing protein [Verrucomicrobiota bacterium]